MIEDITQHLGKDYLSIKTEDWYLMKAFKEAVEEMGWKYNHSFTKFSADEFSRRMIEASSTLEFEKAAFYKHKLELLEKFQIKSLVVNRKLTNIDVMTITSSETNAFINYLQIKEGSIIFSKNNSISI